MRPFCFQDNLTNALGDVQELDQSNGVQFPFYDLDSNVVYLCGKVKVGKLERRAACHAKNSQGIRKALAC